MNVIIVAATEMEIGPFRKHIQNTSLQCAEVLITGVGMVATPYALTRHLHANRYDLVLQVGVGGSYDNAIVLGELVFVTSEQYGDLGAEDHEQYLDIFEMGLMRMNEFPYEGGKLNTHLSAIQNKINLKQVSGLTVNTVSGNEITIQLRKEKYGCQVESMEGAAFHYVCLQEKIPFVQVRAISNYVTPRDKSQWMMKEAIKNLNEWLIEFVESLQFEKI